MTDEQSTEDTPDTGETAGQDQAGGTAGNDQERSNAEEQSTQDDQQADTAEASDEPDWKAQADKWKALARKHEDSAKGRQAEVDTLREQLAERDVADVTAASSLASERLHTKLARAGVSEQDASALIQHIDPMTLLAEGEPSTDAIDSVATSLSRTVGRSSADTDQGQRTNGAPQSADDWLRKKARS